MSYLSAQRPKFFAHRGASGIFPENTLPAFQSAWDAGLRYFETDVHVTKDGVVVIHHDASSLRTCGHERMIGEMNLDEVRALDAGYAFKGPDGIFPFRGQGVQIPTLEELLRTFPEAYFNVEVKSKSPAGSEEKIISLIEALHKQDQILLAAEKQPIMDAIRKRWTGVTGFTEPEVVQFIEWVRGGARGAYRAPGNCVQVPEFYGQTKIVVPEIVQAVRQLKLEMHVWVVNDPVKMRELLTLGVDGIMTDFPELVRELR